MDRNIMKKGSLSPTGVYYNRRLQMVKKHSIRLKSAEHNFDAVLIDIEMA